MGAANAGHVLTKGHASGRSAASENAVVESVVSQRGVPVAIDCSSVSLRSADVSDRSVS